MKKVSVEIFKVWSNSGGFGSISDYIWDNYDNTLTTPILLSFLHRPILSDFILHPALFRTGISSTAGLHPRWTDVSMATGPLVDGWCTEGFRERCGAVEKVQQGLQCRLGAESAGGEARILHVIVLVWNDSGGKSFQTETLFWKLIHAGSKDFYIKKHLSVHFLKLHKKCFFLCVCGEIKNNKSQKLISISYFYYTCDVKSGNIQQNWAWIKRQFFRFLWPEDVK